MAEIVSRLGTEPETILRISAVAQIAPRPHQQPDGLAAEPGAEDVGRPGGGRGTRSGSAQYSGATVAAGGAQGARAWGRA